MVLDGADVRGFWLSLISALLVELPLAALAILGARRLLRMTSGVLLRYQGQGGPTPRLRELRLVGTAGGRPLHELLTTTTPGELESSAGPAGAGWPIPAVRLD